jgi:hypothetical protein
MFYGGCWMLPSSSPIFRMTLEVHYAHTSMEELSGIDFRDERCLAPDVRINDVAVVDVMQLALMFALQSSRLSLPSSFAFSPTSKYHLHATCNDIEYISRFNTPISGFKITFHV